MLFIIYEHEIPNSRIKNNIDVFSQIYKKKKKKKKTMCNLILMLSSNYLKKLCNNL